MTATVPSVSFVLLAYDEEASIVQMGWSYQEMLGIRL